MTEAPRFEERTHARTAVCAVPYLLCPETGQSHDQSSVAAGAQYHVSVTSPDTDRG